MDAQEDLRSRKSAPARIAQILDVADQLVIEAGALPISMKKVGDLMGASRALVYAYFPIRTAWPRRCLSGGCAGWPRRG
jgi:AcrR family transcriptional regulator